MRPVIGVCAKFSWDDEIGIRMKLGVRMQHWHILADDYINAIETAGGVPIIIPFYESHQNNTEVLNIKKGYSCHAF